MNVPVVIPQIFYDVIARVLPGFLFLVMLKMIVIDTITGFNYFGIMQSSNSFEILFYGITYFILCYFIGWILKIYTYHGLKYELEQAPKDISVRFQEIRLKNEAAGFRILKLRAEARMWEAIRNGTFLLFILLVVIFIIDKLMIFNLNTQSQLIFLFKFILLIILLLASDKAMKGAIKNYVDNIISIYSILFNIKERSIEK